MAETTEKLEQQIEENLPCCEQHEPQNKKDNALQKKMTDLKNQYFVGVSIIIAALIIGATWLYISQSGTVSGKAKVLSTKERAKLEKIVLPQEGVTLPVVWGDLGKQLVMNGTIDSKKFNDLYAQRGGMDEGMKKLLENSDNGKLVITRDNANFVLNLLWALGLANKNLILEKGEMMDKQYGGAGSFASTGGWTLAKGNTMNHYSRHGMITLTDEQQTVVDRVSRNIFRPCCGNSVHFPDCNHGMAMLGLLELMAAQGVTETEMYKAALAVNSLWFPDTYLTIAQYLKMKGLDWAKMEPKALLAANFSGAQGYAAILKEVQPVQSSSSSCGA